MLLKFTLTLLATCLSIAATCLVADEATAWKMRVQQGTYALPVILQELESASPTKANWLRTAADAIIEKALSSGESLDLKPFQTVLFDIKRNPKVRRMCYEWIITAKPELKSELISSFLNDPSLELRRDAVAQLINQVKDKSDAGAIDWRNIAKYARDRDQVDEIAKALKKWNEELDTAAHFGFIRDWAVLSTFDNTDEKGFAISYEPEKKLDFQTTYVGKENKPATWKKITSTDAYGKVDLAKSIGKHKAAIAYAVAIVEPVIHEKDSKLEIPVELRANSLNAVKVWLNGKEVIAHEEYHHGDNMDQYIGKGSLKPGKNIILVKICQNDQKEPWAQSWEFALRVCDHVGTATPLKVLPAPIEDTQEK